MAASRQATPLLRITEIGPVTDSGRITGLAGSMAADTADFGTALFAPTAAGGLFGFISE
jgi:hypothetical protein